MMIEKGKMYKNKIQQKRTEKEASETDGCTFNPQTNQKLNKQLYGKDQTLQDRYAAAGSSQNKEQVFTMLYEKGRVKNGPRQDRSPIEIEYEKNGNECTFKPIMIAQKYKNVSPKAVKPGPSKPKVSQNHLNQKQKRPESDGQGQQSTDKNQESQTLKNQPKTSDELLRNILEDDRTPLLYLEVNLGHNVVSKLVVFEGDNPMNVVEQFAIANKLSEEKKKKLAKVVQD